MGVQTVAEVDGFVGNFKTPVPELCWAAFEDEFAADIAAIPPSQHFYYVKPAAGHVLWPEMGEYDAGHSTFVGDGTAEAVAALRSSRL